MSGSRKKVLVTGFGPHLPSDMRANTMARIAADTKAGADAGFDFTIVHVDPRDPEGTLSNVKDALKQGHWDVYSIGFGVRGDKSITPLFEKLVALAREHCSSSTKFIFATAPDAVLAGCQRAFAE